MSDEQGNAMLCGWDAGDETKERVIDCLAQDACRILPSGCVFEIRGKMPPAAVGDKCDYGRSPVTEEMLDRQIKQWGIAWYYKPASNGEGSHEVEISDDSGQKIDSIQVPNHRTNGTNGELFRDYIADAKVAPYLGCIMIARIKVP